MIRIASILLVLAALAAAGLQAARSLRPTNAMRVVGTAVTDSRAAARPVAARRRDAPHHPLAGMMPTQHRLIAEQ